MTEQVEAVIILPAGGSGQRLGSSTPKQFINVCGKPVICYTIEAFMCSIPWVKEIIIPIPKQWNEFCLQLKKDHSFSKVRFVEGMETRHQSIFSGIKALRGCKDFDIVVVHDAVRPFLKEEFLGKICSAAKIHKASGAVRPLVSTVIKSSEDGFMIQSLKRSEFRESHTPQAFHYSLILKAYQQCSDDDFEFGTEVLHLVQKYCDDISPKLVDGPEYLWKVTHQKDLVLMKNFIEDETKS